MSIRGTAQRPSRLRRPLMTDELLMVAGLVLVLAMVVLLVVGG